MKYSVFATDYDGTIAHHGDVSQATLDGLRRLKSAGFTLLMVTGREIPDLHRVFSHATLFDWIVAENGALLYRPETKEEFLLAHPPTPQFAENLRLAGVNQLSVGRVIIGTQEMYLGVVQQWIEKMDLKLDIIMNKGCVMILPAGVNKATGLKYILGQLKVPREKTVAVGDAENDLVMLKLAGFGVAVGNALPEVKRRADFVTKRGHGEGVVDLIDDLLKDHLLVGVTG